MGNGAKAIVEPKQEETVADVAPRKYVFGPVLSRRLGRSLGIDPIPSKTCNWNCVYCQLGRTTPLQSERAEYVPTEGILEEVERALSVLSTDDVDWVTFVGSGEPLLHANIGGLIRGVQKLTTIPVAVITNGSLLSRTEVRDAVSAADAVLPTLDAGTADLFHWINRPHPGISFQQHVDGLKAFRGQYTGRLFLEVMLIKDLNDSQTVLRQLSELIAEIQPDEVHISLPDRPPAETWVQPADMESVMRASAILGGVSKVLHPGESILTLDDPTDALGNILAVIGRHPLSEAQLGRALSGLVPDEKARVLKALGNCEQAKPIQRYGSVFWVSSSARFPDGLNATTGKRT